MAERSFDISRRLALALAVAPAALMTSRAEAQGSSGRPVNTRTALSGDVKAAPRERQSYFDLRQVTLKDGPLLQAREANFAFIRRVDPDRLLHTFRLNAGLPSSAAPLGGWEAPGCELRGHFAGHYLSAVSLAYAATGDADMKRRSAQLVSGLAECQTKLNAGGYLSAFPMEEFDRLSEHRAVWAPFYTVHKIMAGLLDAHAHAGDPQALAVATGMATWVDGWTAARSDAHMQDILDNEFGGMNEALYNLAAATGDDRWIEVGDRFTKARFIAPLADRRDELRGLHMNTHVPQVIGMARRYQMTGERRYGHAAGFFWDTVVEGRTYVTGGASNREHWLSEPYQTGDEWRQSADHQECCCAYNMMKLTRSLHQLAPDVRYIDYYERNLFNHRLGAIHPETGRTTYFLSLAPGAWKTLATDDHTFWCCTGTGVEEFSKLNDTIYSHDGRGVYVNLFVASELSWPERGVRLEQQTQFPAQPRTTLLVEDAPGDAWPLRVRMPGWTTDAAEVRVNGRLLEAQAEPGGYLQITRPWKRGDRIEVELPMPLTTESFPDEPGTQAVLAGPIVLAGQYPAGDLPSTLVVDKQGPAVQEAMITIPPVQTRGRPLTSLLQPVAGQPLTYTLAGQTQPILLKPLNQSWERHNVYWTVV